jgi:hypothetical protein
MSKQPESLRHLGRNGTLPYTLLNSLDEIPVIFEFAGIFNQQPVRWQATLWLTAEHPNPCPDQGAQFMEIGEENNGMRSIAIGLDIDQIDHATLLMTTIMVRKYKRLREGLICFGKTSA